MLPCWPSLPQYKTNPYLITLISHYEQCLNKKDPSNHPSILFTPLRSNMFQLLLGDPKAFPGQMRSIIRPVSSGSSPSRLYPENLQREAPWRLPNQDAQTTSAVSFNIKEQQLFHAEPSHHPEESLYTCMLHFSSNSQLQLTD